MKKIVIFGSTGSIGESTLNVIRKDKKKFKVVGLCANRNIKSLCRQIKEFSPSYVWVRDEKKADSLKKIVGNGLKIFKGDQGLDEFASLRSDISVMAISGIYCLRPLLKNIEYAKRIALANKESLVAAGDIVFNKAKKFNVDIFPVDSEINALFQLIEPGLNRKKPGYDFQKVYITASGGALSGYNKNDFDRVTVREVLRHPTWRMGKRVTVDSATLVNKGFEVIETHHFFRLPYSKIDVIIHKESNIHALIEHKDKTLFACLYPPDMQIPISFALYYPGRSGFDYSCNGKTAGKGGTFDGKNSFSYSFSPVDYEKYPLLGITIEAAKRNDNSLVILNACDEVAIDYFLKGKIKFSGIYKAISRIFEDYDSRKIRTVEDVFFWDAWGRRKTEEFLDKL